MRATHLTTFKFFALLFLLPGLGGLIVSAMVSTHYLQALPKVPIPEQKRMIPRGIHGITVYQTAEEDRNLNVLEYSSVAVFFIGLILGLVYLEKWGAAQTTAAEEEVLLEHPS
jgi:hypothetical protein